MNPTLIRKRFLGRTFNDWSVQLQLLWSIPRKNEFCSYKEKGFEMDEITCYATLKETEMEELPCKVLGCFENLVRFPKCKAKRILFQDSFDLGVSSIVSVKAHY